VNTAIYTALTAANIEMSPPTEMNLHVDEDTIGKVREITGQNGGGE
jgi:hypothetical protein